MIGAIKYLIDDVLSLGAVRTPVVSQLGWLFLTEVSISLPHQCGGIAPQLQVLIASCNRLINWADCSSLNCISLRYSAS